FNPFITTIAVNPVKVVDLLRRRVTPGKIATFKVRGVGSKRPKVYAVRVLTQHRPTRKPNRGRVRWGRVFGIPTVPKPITHTLSITVASLVDTKLIRTRPHTRSTWVNGFGTFRVNPKVKPVKVVAQIIRKRRLPSTRTQVTTVRGKRT